MSQQIDSVLDKIARLKALHANPGTQHEAEAAAAAIARLMLRHSLTQAQVDAAGVEATLIGAEPFTYNLRRERTYARALFGGIAKVMFGRSAYTQGTPLITVIARKHNREAIIELYEYLLPIMERQARAGYKAYRNDWSGWYRPVPRGTWETGFLTGFVSAIADRLAEQQEWLAAQQNTGSAIALLTDEVDAAYDEWAKHQRFAGSHSRGVNAAGYAAGQQAGRATSLADRFQG